MPKLPVAKMISVSRDFLLSRRNPKDMGWGLNIEKGYGISSVVNTAEALHVLRITNTPISDLRQTASFVRENLVTRTKEHDVLRYHAFGIHALLECGATLSDSTIRTSMKRLLGFCKDGGFSQSHSDEPSMFWTYQALNALLRIRGREATLKLAKPILKHALSEGHGSGWHVPFRNGGSPSLGALAYLVSIVDRLDPENTALPEMRNALEEQSLESLSRNHHLDVEAVLGTDWHHYCCCASIHAIFDHRTTLSNRLVILGSMFYESAVAHFAADKGFYEPQRKMVNVRSIFNWVRALHSVQRSLDTMDLSIMRDRYIPHVVPQSVFLSGSFSKEDKGVFDIAENLLLSRDVRVIKGDTGPRGSLSASVIDKLRKCEKILGVMTKRFRIQASSKFTPSPWLIEEKAMAVILKKPLVLLVEDCLDRQSIGGISGDDRFVSFNRNNFPARCRQAVEMLLAK